MKKLTLAFLFLSITLFSCDDGRTVVVKPSDNVNVNSTTDSSAMGLDLQALGELVKSSPDAKTIEQKLNQPNSINNLDLDKDGKTDYISVTEYSTNGVRGFSFVANLNDGTKQECATVELKPRQDNATQADLNIVGNQNVYGQNSCYTSNYLLTDLLIYHYLFAPSWTPYYSPYYYGYYPSYYHSYYRSPYSSYHSRMYNSYHTSHITRTTTIIHSYSPNTSRYSSKSYASSRSYSRPSASSNTRSSYSRPSGSSSSNRSSSRSSSSRNSSSHNSSSRHR